MQQLLASLPNGNYDLNLNVVSQDGEFTASYALIVVKSSTSLQGQLRTPAGGNATGLAGKKMLLAGYNNHQRQVAVVDATGAFHFDGVLPDTYQLTLNDLVHPNVVSVSAVVFGNSSSVSVGIVYPYAPGLAQRTTAQSYVAGTVTQDGAEPPVRAVPASPRAAGDVTAQDDEASKTFSATAATQHQTITSPVAFTVAADQAGGQSAGAVCIRGARRGHGHAHLAAGIALHAGGGDDYGSQYRSVVRRRRSRLQIRPKGGKWH